MFRTVPLSTIRSFSLYTQQYIQVPSREVFCSESIECFPGTVFKFFLKLLVSIPVAPIITGTIVHFRFHIRCISIHKLLYFNFFSASFCTIYQCACFLFFVFNYYIWPICCNFSVCVYCLIPQHCDISVYILLLLINTGLLTTCSQAVSKPVRHIPLLLTAVSKPVCIAVCTVKNS